MSNIISILPSHLSESSVVTQNELDLKEKWVEAVSVNNKEKSVSEEWLDGWLSTSVPFSFRYGGQESPPLLGRWRLEKEKLKSSDGRQIIWVDTKTGLRLTWQIKNFVDYPALEWLLWFENIGEKDTALIENIQALDLHLKHLQKEKPYIIHGANGGRSMPDDFMPFSWQVPYIGHGASKRNEIQLGSDHPPSNEFFYMEPAILSSSRHLPFFNIETPEDRGVLVGVGWSGRWLARVKVEDTRLRTQIGLKESRFILHPGEKARTPRILLVFWKGARLHGHNMLRQVLHKYYVPRLQGKLQEPLVSVNACFTHHGTGDFLHEATEEKVLPLVEPFIKLGVELFIIDAGWYKGEPWLDWMGDWEHDEKKYPHGFRPISKPLATANVFFGLWFASELVSNNVPLVQEHPEWIRPTSGWKFGGTLRMEVSEAREWFLQKVECLIENELLSCYRQDGAGAYDPEPEFRKGISETMHITGLYALWDTLRQRHPNLVMEGCSGGGRRIDLETVSFFHWHQKSDRWYDSESDQCGLYGVNLYLPGGLINIPTQATDDYGVWSSFAGQLCLGWHPIDEDFPMNIAARQIERYKRIRPLLSGDFYPLTPCSLAEPWIGYQFHRVDLDEGFALLFRRSNSEKAVYPANDTFKMRLRGVDPQTRYDIHFERSDHNEIIMGKELSKGIEVTIREIPGVEKVNYNSVR